MSRSTTSAARWARRLTLAVVVAMPLLATAALGAPPAGATTQTFTTETVNFTSPGESTYAVPTNATALTITLIGAAGASTSATGAATGTGGSGAEVEATITPPSGDSSLYIEVGAIGAAYGGGSSGDAGAGGGDSAVQTCSVTVASCLTSEAGTPGSDPRLFVAGGGGGGGANGSAAGGGGGSAGASDTVTSPGTGGAGTDSAGGGSGGSAGLDDSANSGFSGAGPGSGDCTSSADGINGTTLDGGAGGSALVSGTSTAAADGGGGGGGWVGGSGGGGGDCGTAGAGGGGGAGTSFAESAATNVSVTTATAVASVEIVATLAIAPTFTSGNAATFTTGAAGTFTVTTAASPEPVTLSETGTLPSGVTFADNGDGTGTLAGTPASGTGGQYTVTLGATNGVSPDASQTFTLTVDQPPAITSAAAATFVVGDAGTFAITTTGYPDASVSDGGVALPSGLTLTNNAGTATLAGTPAAGTAGLYALVLVADNGPMFAGAQQDFALTVDQAPAITSASSTTFAEGVASSFTVTASGFPASAGIALSETGSLPAGVTFVDQKDGTALLSGTPSPGTGAVYPITITASNGVAPAATQPFVLTVTEAPAFTSAGGTTFTVGANGTFTVKSSGYPLPTLTESGTPPSGVTFTPGAGGTAVIAGDPVTGSDGVHTLQITASNGIAPAATQSFSLVVDQAPAVTSTAAATFSVGGSGSYVVTTTGYPTASITESGALPSGVTFVDGHHGSATLSGRPATRTGGVYRFTISASNGVSPVATQPFTLTVLEAPLFTSAPTATFALGTHGSFVVTVVGYAGGGPMHLSAAGTLPAGLTFHDNGNGTATISGTPSLTSAVLYPISVTASNGVLPSATQQLTVHVDSTLGYLLLQANGGVYVFGGMRFKGSLPGRGIVVDNMVGAAETTDANGYWLVDGEGGVFTFGDAGQFGIAQGKPLNLPVAGIVPTPDNGGYWLVARDGGVFTFGDAHYRGSLPGSGITVDDIVGMAATRDGLGYYLVGANGTVYAYGDAVPHGSEADAGSAIVGIALDRQTDGYWLVSANGSIFSFDASFFGATPSLGGIIGMVPSVDDGGYLILDRNGTVYPHGDARFAGSEPSGSTSPVVAISAP